MNQLSLDLNTVRFDGPVYDPKLDKVRLVGQIRRVFDYMKDGNWGTLRQIGEYTGDPESSISAQLRHLRKERFGKHTVEKRRREGGLWEYRLIVNDGSKNEQNKKGL